MRPLSSRLRCLTCPHQPLALPWPVSPERRRLRIANAIRKMTVRHVEVEVECECLTCGGVEMLDNLSATSSPCCSHPFPHQMHAWPSTVIYPETKLPPLQPQQGSEQRACQRREQPTPTSFHSCAERLIIIPLRLHPNHLHSLSHNCSLDLHRDFHASIRLLRTVHGSIVPASPVLSYFGCYRRRPTLSEPTGIFCPSGYIHPPGPTDNIHETTSAVLLVHRRLINNYTFFILRSAQYLTSAF